MSNIPFSSSFACVSTLREYMDALVTDGQCVKSDDPADYRRFAETTLVGHTRISNRVPYHEPVERVTDTAIKVIKWILQSERNKGVEEKGKVRKGQQQQQRNMLALGYSMCKAGSTNCVKGMRELSSHCISSPMVELAKHR
ncbi:hypothetical protein EV175_005280, partial [Coemansia sp. RSA 1933]